MPRQATPKADHSILEMAIVGYQSQLEQLNAKIAEIKALLGQRGPGRPKGSTNEAKKAAKPSKRTISAAGRARIAAAQRARWAAQKKEAPAKAKRKISAAGLNAIREATKKRWEAYRKAHAAAS